jgi:hypothetical protein
MNRVRIAGVVASALAGLFLLSLSGRSSLAVDTSTIRSTYYGGNCKCSLEQKCQGVQQLCDENQDCGLLGDPCRTGTLSWYYPFNCCITGGDTDGTCGTPNPTMTCWETYQCKCKGLIARCRKSTVDTHPETYVPGCGA